MTDASPDAGDELGTVSVNPTHAEAGAWGTWTLTFTVGVRGLRAGGGIRIQLPDSWHVWYRNSARQPQTSDPTAAHYVSARCSRPGVAVHATVEDEHPAEFVKNPRVGIDGRANRYAHVIRVTLDGPSLGAGDHLDVTIGDQRGGSPGFAAAFHANGLEYVQVAVDPDGWDEWTILTPRARIEVVPRPAVELTTIAPSTVALGELSHLRIAAMDRYGNLDTSFAGLVHIKSALPQAQVVSEIELTNSDGGLAIVPFRAASAGVLRFEVSVGDLHSMSNPTRCVGGDVQRRLFWGDLHCHARRSWDAFGNNPFEYGRVASGLDFMALTDHVEEWEHDEWNLHRREVESHHRPGEFVTLLAYEACFDRPWGHHNVFFRGEDGPVLGAQFTLPELWASLPPERSFTIPHHTGVGFSTPGAGPSPSDHRPNPDWTVDDPILRTLIELYSGHGQCEYFDPNHPLAYERTNFTFSYSEPGPYYAQDAWLLGLHLGSIASSDDHHGQPGRAEYGLTGVWATDLTRESIFESLLARQTIATTGSRIIAELDLVEPPNGSGSDASGRRLPELRLSVNGTAELDRVEIVRGDLVAGEFRIVQQWVGLDGMDFGAQWVDPSPPRAGLYYARVTQRSTYRGRAVMAWTTPVWLGQRP